MATDQRVAAAQQSHVDQHEQSEGSAAELGSQSDHSGQQPLGANAVTGEQPEAAIQGEQAEQPSGKKGLKFWLIFPPLCIATLLVALESTVTSTALPTISAVLHAGNEYTWYANAYLLANTAVLPLWGQFAWVFGRRYPIMLAVAVFMIGSGISGGANSSAMMIAGRTIQGCGGAGISVLTQLIVSDLVSVRERGKYMSIIFSVFGIGTSIGPVLGGVIVKNGSTDSWRWVFWLNLPICAVTLILQAIFLQLTFSRQITFTQKLKQIDWIGNLLLIGSVIAVLIALSWADTRYPWSNWHIIFPLVIGFVGWAVFHVWEASPFCARPTVSPKAFSTRTSAVGLVLTFLQSMLTYWIIYFLPVYFQSVLLVSPGRSGVLLLPSVLIGIPSSMIAGTLMSKYGRYKPIHLVSFGIMTLGVGLFINFDSGSGLAKVVLYQCVTGFGSGALLTTMLPAIQAALPPSETSTAVSTWGFIRAYGYIWGIALPTAIFNSRAAAMLPTISDPAIRQVLGGGDAYSHISRGFVQSLTPASRVEVIHLYSSVLRTLWEVCLALTGLCFLLTLLEKEVTMQTTVKSDFGLKEKEQKADEERTGGASKAEAAEQASVEKQE